MTWKTSAAPVALAAWLLAACAHYPLNAPLPEAPPAPAYAFDERPQGENTNELLVCVTFSGGGTRAAALAYGVLQKLRDTRIRWNGRDKRLLDEVDCISSVSGGSFTAAYYGLFGERLFADFRERFLERDVQGALLARALAPQNLARLASPTFGRSDLAAEYYDEALFEGQTFARLGAGGRRPFVIINATNMASGERFEFTQAEFNVLGSDLGTYPVARAVAASSAFPILLTPLSLRNYPAPESVKVSPDMRRGLDDFRDNRRRYQWAAKRVPYVDAERKPYVHLLDGGLADNIGLRPVETAYRRSSGFIRKLVNDGAVRRLLFIVVNAHTEGADRISARAEPPGKAAVALATATIALDNYSFESVETIKDLRDERLRAQRSVAACQSRLDACPGAPRLPQFPSDLQPFVVDVDFEALADKSERDYFLGLPTSFHLPPEAVARLVDVGGKLLDADPDFRRFLEGLQP